MLLSGGAMNRLAFYMILLSGVLAHACPNLVGIFGCANSANETFPVTITQTVKHGVTIYNFDYKYQSMEPYDAVADGTFKKLVNKEFNGVQKYTCVDNALAYEKIGEHYQNGKAYAHSTLEITDQINADGNLETHTHLNLKNYDQEKPSDFKFKEICRRVN
jgi:hypothetical protein